MKTNIKRSAFRKVWEPLTSEELAAAGLDLLDIKRNARQIVERGLQRGFISHGGYTQFLAAGRATGGRKAKASNPALRVETAG